VNIAIRIALLLLTAGVVVLSFVLAERQDSHTGRTGKRYGCPMHPEIVLERPAKCPICGMPLALIGPTRAGDPLVRVPTAAASVAPMNQENDDWIQTVTPTAFTREVRAPAWVESPGLIAAHLYRDELRSVLPGDRGWFVPTSVADVPEHRVQVRRTDDVAAPWDGSTSVVHLRFDAARTATLGARVVGWVGFPSGPREDLLVPESAVLHADDGSYVFAESGDGAPPGRRSVEIGRAFAGYAVLLSGVRNLERVMVTGAFFADAEQRLATELERGIEPTR
jgi:hypothetical protein